VVQNDDLVETCFSVPQPMTSRSFGIFTTHSLIGRYESLGPPSSARRRFDLRLVGDFLEEEIRLSAEDRDAGQT